MSCCLLLKNCEVNGTGIETQLSLAHAPAQYFDTYSKDGSPKELHTTYNYSYTLDTLK